MAKTAILSSSRLPFRHIGAKPRTKLTTLWNRPCARASQQRSLRHGKRESQHHV